MTSLNPKRDGGKFTRYAQCPKCGLLDLHHVRRPNMDPPQIVKVRPGEAAMMGGRPTIVQGGDFVRVIGGVRESRWDERPYEIIRICECGWEFGQT